MKEHFNNLKVGKKLIAAFATIIILYSVTVIASVINIKSMSDRMDKLYREPFANVQSSLKAIEDIQNIRRSLLVAAVSNDTGEKTTAISEMEETAADAEIELQSLTTGYISGEDNIDDLVTMYNAAKVKREKMLSLLEENREEEALEVYLNEYNPQSQTLTDRLSEVCDISVKDAEDNVQEGENANRNIIILMVLLAAVCVGITIALWIVITRSIVAPINAVKRAANQIANGKLSIDLTYESKNELGELAADVRSTADTLDLYVQDIRKELQAIGKGRLNYHSDVEYKGEFEVLDRTMAEIVEMLRESIQQIGSSAELVSVSAEQVSNGAQVLAQGVSEQAGSVEELAVSINEIADSVRENADSAVHSRELSDSVGEKMKESNKLMLELMEAIQQIHKNSSEITGIVKEIEDIAFQTNILSLNASVEAARAGEAGRGFSVVAGEIRRLAAKTSGASKLTAQLAETNSQAVKTGVTFVQETATKLQESMDSARKVNSMVNKISEVSVGQADAVAQIRKSVELISDIVQGNSATSEESAAASEELSAQAEILKELVEQFEL